MAVRNQFRNAADFCGYHRATRGHRFEDNHSESFGQRREREYVDRLHHHRNVFAESSPYRFDSEALRLQPQIRIQRPTPDHEQARFRIGFRVQAKAFEKNVHSLDRNEPANGANNKSVLSDAEAFAEVLHLGILNSIVGGRVEPVVDGLKATRDMGWQDSLVVPLRGISERDDCGSSSEDQAFGKDSSGTPIDFLLMPRDDERRASANEGETAIDFSRREMRVDDVGLELPYCGAELSQGSKVSVVPHSETEHGNAMFLEGRSPIPISLQVGARDCIASVCLQMSKFRDVVFGTASDEGGNYVQDAHV